MIKGVKEEDGGLYMCQARNAGGIRQVTVELTVEGKNVSSQAQIPFQKLFFSVQCPLFHPLFHPKASVENKGQNASWLPFFYALANSVEERSTVIENTQAEMCTCCREFERQGLQP